MEWNEWNKWNGMEWNVPFGMCVCKLKTAYRKILSQTEDPP